MNFSVSFGNTLRNPADSALVFVYKDNRLSAGAEELDRDNGGLITHYLGRQDKFSGKSGQALVLSAPKDSAYTRLILVGLGDAAKLDAQGCETIGGKLFPVLAAHGVRRAHILAGGEQALDKIDVPDMLAHILLGLRLRSYRFDKYKKAGSDKDDSNNGKALLEAIEVITDHDKDGAQLDETYQAVAEGVFFARDLVNEPPNMLFPESFAERIKTELKPLGVEVEIFDEKKMHKLGFHAHLSVGQGSEQASCVVVMRWNGLKSSSSNGKDKAGPVAFVGKGITFDTGGINIKPSGGMEDMKMDMGGAAATVGVMKTLARRKAKADVISIVGLAENMPSHMAYRPSDIISSMAGKTIEVMNTDAEGRLVLADCLTYVQKEYKPQLVIDLATLTGAIMVALGHEYCGGFVNDDTLWQQLEQAAKNGNEKLWRMPLDEAYKKDMESPIADLRSLGGSGRMGGACTAAGFLQHFIEDGTRWAHLDIAGTAWVKQDSPLGPKPATGYGVRLLDRLVAGYYERG